MLSSSFSSRAVVDLPTATEPATPITKGVRRTSSKSGGRLEPFQHIDIQFAEGRGALEVVTQVEALHSSKLGADYSRFTAAEVLVETADRLVSEYRDPALQQYWLLVGALRTLGDGTPDEVRSNPEVIDAYLGVAHE